MTEKELKESEEIKTQEPEEQTEEKPKDTTIKISPETKARLDEQKETAKQPTFDALINYLLDNNPDRKSDENTVILEMPKSKYVWLLGHQDKCDCRTVLKRSVR